MLYRSKKNPRSLLNLYAPNCDKPTYAISDIFSLFVLFLTFKSIMSVLNKYEEIAMDISTNL